MSIVFTASKRKKGIFFSRWLLAKPTYVRIYCVGFFWHSPEQSLWIPKPTSWRLAGPVKSRRRPRRRRRTRPPPRTICLISYCRCQCRCCCCRTSEARFRSSSWSWSGGGGPKTETEPNWTRKDSAEKKKEILLSLSLSFRPHISFRSAFSLFPLGLVYVQRDETM